MSESYKQHIVKRSVIYQKSEGELKEFEKRVNSAAADLCLRDVKLLDKRGMLLQLARRKVADEGYVFRKGHSRSKVYGVTPAENTPKRPKYNQEMREDRLEAIEDELADISRIMQFKEKRLSQAEATKKYSVCEQLSIEIKELKDNKRVLQLEKQNFMKKEKRAKRRQVTLQQNDSEYSDVDADGPNSSRSEKSRSTTPASSIPPFRFKSPSSPSSSESVSIKEHMHVDAGQSPLLPSLHGSRINPINCESDSPPASDDSMIPATTCCSTDPHF